MVRLRRRLAVVSLFLLAHAVGAAPLPVAGIARVGYRVSDAAKSQAFYSGVLGLQRMDAPGGAALYKVSDQQYIEIAPGLNATEDVRLTYIALETTDIRLLHRLLRSRGLSAKPPVKDARGDLSIFARKRRRARASSSSNIAPVRSNARPVPSSSIRPAYRAICNT